MDGLLDRYAGLALWLQSLIALAGLVVVALAVNWLIKRVLLRAAAPYLCLLYTSPSPRDKRQSRMPSSA